MAAVVGSLLAELGVDKSGLANGLRAAGVDLTNFENRTSRQFQRIDRTASGSFTSMGAAAGRFAKVGLGSLTVAAVGAMAPVLSLAGALNKAKDAMADFSKTGDVAARLGVHVERLQELRFAAEQGGMAVGNFDVAFRRFIRRSSEAAHGTGAAKDAFKELNIQLRDGDGRLKESDKLLGEVADALRNVQNPADKLRLAFKLFDTDGAAMVNVLAAGSAGLDEFSRKARDLGIVVDRDMIQRAQQMQTEFDTATRVIDMQFKQALVDLAPVIVSIAEAAARLAGDIRSMVDAMREFEGQSSRSLDRRLVELGRERLEIEEKILRLRDEMRNNSSFLAPIENRVIEGTIKALEEQLEEITSKEAEILSILGRRGGEAFASGIADGIEAGTGEIVDATRKAADEAAKELERFRSTASRFVEEMFPGHAAAAEAEELLRLLEQFGDELTDLERQAVENRIDLMFASAAAGVRDLSTQSEKSAKVIKKSFDPVAELFDGLLDALYSSGDAFENIMRSAAGVGRRFAQMGLDNLLGGLQNSSFSAPEPNIARVESSINRMADTMSVASDDLAGNIRRAANVLGTSAHDLATVISFETGGTFSTDIRGGAGNRHIGLIQFGPEEQRRYGAAIGQTLTEQMDAVIRYLQDRGFKPGMGGLDLYSTINAGRPGLYNRSDAANGGTWGSVADKWNHQMDGHRANADRILGKQAVSDGVVDANRRIQTFGGQPESFDTGTGAPGVFGQGMKDIFGIGAAAFGAFAGGFQSGSPVMGALSGAMSGLGAAPMIASAFPALGAMATPIGLIGGAIVGLRLGGTATKRKRIAA